jgi:DTW domain-containing protein YfiP
VQLSDYLKKKLQKNTKAAEPWLSRDFCAQCLTPGLTCYCRKLRAFDPKIRFAILIHWREAKKRIATGRLSHRCLENSWLLPGYDYSTDEKVNSLIEDPRFHCVVLYPGEGSVNLSSLPSSERSSLFPAGKELVVFVIDGTWITARKTMQRSRNLALLPRISFLPTSPSRFRVRKQPKPECYSTLEAIHQTIELLGESRGFDLGSRRHDGLLRVFDHVIEQRLELAETRQRKHRLPPR